MIRIDSHPTHKYTFNDQIFKLRAGKPLPFGATIIPGGVNFSVYSRHAHSCELALFEKHASEPYAIIPFFDEFRIGNAFSMVVFDVDYENVEYAFRMDGPNDFREGHWFDKSRFLLDPYAKSIGGRDIWGASPDWYQTYQHRARIVFDDFDWEDDNLLNIPMEDLIIYEMHVRSFTRHASSGVKYPGTFSAIIQKLPYLKKLGINCIELLPVFEFDEFENSRINEDTGESLFNYWGYSNVGFFAPKAGYAATGKWGMQVDEFKNLIKTLHHNGFEVFLDVVFNHTAEGNEKGPYISYRGIDNKTYYMLTPDGYYFNFSGCGNTLNCNNPIVRSMILDCLRYWVTDYHIDGFRFDLAAILGRDQNGAPMQSPPLLEHLAYDPILGKCKLIAEAWDAGGLYQVGSFPSWNRWAEWNGKYRDDIRRFLKGEVNAERIGRRIIGSPDLYQWNGRGLNASINFITAHDGFTLMDLVSYNDKHNEANGHFNSDGDDHNNSWNCGAEGETDDPGIKRLRFKQIKNAAGILLISQGIPMILAGDEMGNTQYGNNNAYCQDNEISWIDWDRLDSHTELFNYYSRMIDFRKKHPILRNNTHLQNRDYVGSGYPDISWHGIKAWQPWTTYHDLTLAFMLDGHHARGGTEKDDFIYVAINMHWEMHGFELPQLPYGQAWHIFVNTDMVPPFDIAEPGEEILLDNQDEILVGPRGMVILTGK
jgi:glycogen operon protein